MKEFTIIIWVFLFVHLNILPIGGTPDSYNDNEDESNIHKIMNLERLKIKIDKSVADQLKNSKFYAKGQTNVGCDEEDSMGTCDPKIKWGPAKDQSYFLYDREPFVDEEIKIRTKRKYEQVKEEEEDYDAGDNLCKESDVEHMEDDLNNGDNEDDNSNNSRLAENTRAEYNIKQKQVTHHHMWDNWRAWGPCSKTCGEGTKSRWRHCLSPSCPKGEKEAQLQTCFNLKCLSD